MATNLTKVLQTISNDINKLSQKIEKLVAAMDEPAKAKSAKAKSAKKTPAKQAKPEKKTVVKLKKKAPVKKESKVSANLVVLGIIEKSVRAVDIATLKEKSGFQGQKLYNILSMLKKQGKVKNPNKGFYLKE